MSAPWRPDPRGDDDGKDWLGDDWMSEPKQPSNMSFGRWLATSPFGWLATGVVVLGVGTVAADAFLPPVSQTTVRFPAASAAARTVEAAPAPLSRWQTAQSVSPIDDSRQAVAVLPQDGPAGKARLVVTCSGGYTAAYIQWGTYLGEDKFHGSGRKEVTLRSGSEPAVEENVSLTSDGTGTELPGWAVTFLQALVHHDRFAAEIIPYRSGPVTATFTLAGMREAIGPLASACGWEFGVTHLPVLVRFEAGGATLVRTDITTTLTPDTYEIQQKEHSTFYRLGPGTKGAERIEACRNARTDNACYVRARLSGTEVVELVSAKAN